MTRITVSDLENIERLNLLGYNDAEISVELGISYRTVHKYRRDLKLPVRCGVKQKPRQLHPENYYTVYDRYENVVAQGSARECAEQLGIKLNSFYSSVYRARRKPDGAKCRFILTDKMNQEDEEDDW